MDMIIHEGNAVFIKTVLSPVRNCGNTTFIGIYSVTVFYTCVILFTDVLHGTVLPGELVIPGVLDQPGNNQTIKQQ